jgi:hypothetical protein
LQELIIHAFIKALSRLSLHFSFDTSIGRHFVSFSALEIQPSKFFHRGNQIISPKKRPMVLLNYNYFIFSFFSQQNTAAFSIMN